MSPALLDTNVLIHAAYLGSPVHLPAATLVERGLKERGVFCIAPQNLVEFAAVATRRRRGDHPLGGDEVFRITELLYRSRTLAKIYPRRGTVARAMKEGTQLGVSGAAWYDLFLALTMRDAGVRAIVTENVSDFQQFPFITARKIAEDAG
ncbi:MAG TPA: PIN domain-containing protein [Thermoanaerobaculia bacterium]|nr:PIN domain-containing protein [Thermoanaerobaculia bacterium]